MGQGRSPLSHEIQARSSIGMSEALGQSEAFLDFQENLSRVAPINRPVLLIGERGTGKELAASRLHFLSARWQGSLVALNCSALSSSLIEAELFGHERGAFTGAEKRRTGRFEASDRGTLFLDEIGNIPMEVQEKILRVVEYGAFERVGSSESIEVDVRIIAATNADLIALAEEAIDALEAHDWPGNVRELKNLVERAVYRSDATVISHVEFDPFKSQATVQRKSEGKSRTPRPKDVTIEGLMEKPLGEAVRELRILFLRRALKEARFNQKKAALLLGLTYHQFRGLYRKYGKEVA